MSDQNNFTPNLSQLSTQGTELTNAQTTAPTGDIVFDSAATMAATTQPTFIQPTQVVSGGSIDGSGNVTTTHVNSQPVAPTRPVLPPDDASLIFPELAQAEGHIGGGIIVEKEEEKESPFKNGPGLNPEVMDNINSYIADLDKQIEERKEVASEHGIDLEKEREKKKEDTPEEEEDKDPEEVAKELEEKFSEAVVVIDKLGMGTVINFTDEEREKLERVKKIRLEEVETVNIKAVKKKKAKKGSLDKILNRLPSVHTTPIILPASGYTAVLKGCSTYELVSLMGSSENALLDTEAKWSLIHSKIVSTSIGKMSFNEFLKATAAVDYNMFIYGLLCATYPDDDKLPLTCRQKECGKEFDHFYSVRSLIRAEKLSDKLRTLVAKIVDNSHTEETAKLIHAESAVNQVKAVELPRSGVIVEIYVQSAYDLLYNSIKGLSENVDERYSQAAVISTVVQTALVPDPDSDPADPEYYEYTDALDITKTIYNLTDTDILVLTKQSELMLDDLSFEFGLMNVQCEHCGHYRETVPFDIESILFYKYQQAMSTKVE